MLHTHFLYSYFLYVGAGIAQPIWWDSVVTGNGTDKNKDAVPIMHSPTPPTQRRLAKSFSVTPSSANKGSV